MSSPSRPRPLSGVSVRDAVLADVEAIRDIAAAAWRATYAGRISDPSIERFIESAYSPERVTLRLERHRVLVAGIEPEAPVAAFLEIADQGDHVQVVAIYTHPDVRGRGLGSALLARIRDLHPDDDIAADVLVDNPLAEPFYVARGFVPGELLTDEIAGEEISERRWWLRAAPTRR